VRGIGRIWVRLGCVKGKRYAIAAFLPLLLIACGIPEATLPEAFPDSAEEADSVTEVNPEVPLPADDVILQIVLAQAEDLNLCDGFYQPEVAEAESQVYRLDDRALVEVICARAAYQLVYAYGVYQPDGTLQPLQLDVFYPTETGLFERTSEPTVGGLARFDPEQNLLTVFSKARGLGDCGSLADYRWTGTELELETFRYQECSDNPAEEFVEPGDYPQIYPPY
jgi:hypothetical protein